MTLLLSRNWQVIPSKKRFSKTNAATVPKRKESFLAKARAMPATQARGTEQRGRAKCSWIWMWDEKWPQGLPGMHAPGLEGVQTAALL